MFHEALLHLRSAEQGFRTVDMALHAAVARRRLGELRGGDDGQKLIDAADAWMRSQTVSRADASYSPVIVTM